MTKLLFMHVMQWISAKYTLPLHIYFYICFASHPSFNFNYPKIFFSMQLSVALTTSLPR